MIIKRHCGWQSFRNIEEQADKQKKSYRERKKMETNNVLRILHKTTGTIKKDRARQKDGKIIVDEMINEKKRQTNRQTDRQTDRKGVVDERVS